jgi:hypothetical protein
MHRHQFDDRGEDDTEIGDVANASGGIFDDSFGAFVPLSGLTPGHLEIGSTPHTSNGTPSPRRSNDWTDSVFQGTGNCLLSLFLSSVFCFKDFSNNREAGQLAPPLYDHFPLLSC